MNFIDSGFHFCASNHNDSNLFGGRTPVPIKIIRNEIDLAVGIYETKNRTYISLIKIEIEMFNDILKFKLKNESLKNPLLNRGAVGTYNEYGVIPSCSISLKDKYALYTIGFDSRNNSIFHASTGLAYLDKNLKLIKELKGPVLERGPNDPFWAASPYVLKEGKKYKMFYTSSYDYKYIKSIDKSHHLYDIKLRVSNNPEYFRNNSETVVTSLNPNEYAIARPCLIDLKGELYLFYCKRETEFSKDYMIFTKKINNNKISIPEKKDNLLIINSLNDKNFQECQCYPYIIKYNNYLILFYNGLNYGKTGFRIAYKKI